MLHRALAARAQLLQRLRDYFRAHGVLEVETPLLNCASITDPNIHSLSLQHANQRLYLQTSPEFAMKRLLAAGSGDIFQVCKAFRRGEQGRHHRPEFTLLEWYRLDYDHHRLMAEAAELIATLAPQTELATCSLSYWDAMARASVLPQDDLATLYQRSSTLGLAAPAGLTPDALLDWLMVSAIVPHFPANRLTLIHSYPASQAALARIDPTTQLAARFEIYWGQLELANGFWELTDADEQLARFENENAQRRTQGLEQVPIDRALIDALRVGLPPCAGIALGLDRLLMCILGCASLDEVIAPMG